MTSSVEGLKIDYELVYTVANEMLATSSAIESFPYKTRAFLEEQSDIRLCNYAKAYNKYGVDVKAFGSASAVWQEQDGANIIFYNQEEPPSRVRFSIMHEFGHYILGHKMNLQKEDPLYEKQELEANCFAAQILMPEQLLRKASSRGKMLSRDFIKDSFDVSYEAADKRKSTLAKTVPEWRKRAEKEYDDIILFKYAAFLNGIAPVRRDSYDFEEELEKQRLRESYMDTRTWWTN